MTLDLIVEEPSEFLLDVLAGLQDAEKSIDPKWLYDEIGSALFEEITMLPEYYLTRTETQILKDHAGTLAGLVPEGGALVEFGSGASVKTRTLLSAGGHIGTYVPMDISEVFLHETALDLRQRYPGIAIRPVVGDFLNPIALPRDLASTPKVGFFPGSTLGNIAPSSARQLLAGARAWPGIEAFVLGVDLVKDPFVLEAAYDDAAGVTQKFITNILRRLNREFGATFDPQHFDYEAKWNVGMARIEMSLISKGAHVAALGDHPIVFEAGEKIEISKSRKYTPASIEKTARDSGWRVDTLLTDHDELFAIAVLKPADGA